jgi:hypothetical protein
LAEKGMDVPDRLLPKMRVMFWTAQIENRIHLAEILYRKEGYMPARVMLETLASADDVPAIVRQQASEALTRLRLASQTAQNPPPEQRKSLFERWQAMERVQFRTLQNYPRSGGRKPPVACEHPCSARNARRCNSSTTAG